jgi:hypothetical protein
MKTVALALAAMLPLLACAEETPENQEIAANEELAAADQSGVVPTNGGQPGNAAGDGGNSAAATAPRDVAIEDSRPKPTGPLPADRADQCGASRHQWLVGRPRSAIPPQRANWRVTCTDCPITLDHSPARLNIFFDSETERVEEVRCG